VNFRERSETAFFRIFQIFVLACSADGGQFSSEIKVGPVAAAATQEQEVALKFVPFPVCLPGDKELVWLLAKHENLSPEEAGIALSNLEEEFWASKTGQKLIRDRVERSFPEFIARMAGGALGEVGLKRHYETPEPVKLLRCCGPRRNDDGTVQGKFASWLITSSFDPKEHLSRNRRTEKSKDRGGWSQVLVNGELAVHRRAAVVEPAFIPRPGINGWVKGPVRPGGIPWALPFISLLAPWTVGNDTGMESAFAVVPGIHVKNLKRVARSQAGDPGLVERVAAQKVVACCVKSGQVTPRFCRVSLLGEHIADSGLEHEWRCLLAHEHRHVPVAAPAQRSFGRRLNSKCISRC
jgi:hypothetical protein